MLNEASQRAGGTPGGAPTAPRASELEGRPAGLSGRLPALLPVYAQMPVRPVSGHGSWLVDEHGHEWLDAYGGHAVASTGHSHPHVVQAIAEQAAALLFYSTAVPHPNRERLADDWPHAAPTRSADSSSATLARRPMRTRWGWRGVTPGGRRSSPSAAGGTAAP